MPIDHTFSTTLQGGMGPHNWTCAILNPSHEVLGTGKSVKVVAEIDGVVVESSMLPHKGGHMLAIKQSIQDAIGKHAGDTVTIRLREPGS